MPIDLGRVDIWGLCHFEAVFAEKSTQTFGYKRLSGWISRSFVARNDMLWQMSTEPSGGQLHYEVPGINIPEEIRQQMHEAGEQGAQVGVTLAQALGQQLRDSFAQGLYLMPAFGRYDLAAEIIEAL